LDGSSVVRSVNTLGSGIALQQNSYSTFVLLEADNSFINSLYHKLRVIYPKQHVSLINVAVFLSYTRMYEALCKVVLKCFEFRLG